ncbi:MAG: flagellin [Acidobacteriota bacterium]
MSLGVLNNLSAVYAENALNSSQNSLSKTLQQLSSGSRINSGADDAAGLSLINGLQANQTALTQSQTNAQEGVGLLQVADGALSQVTTLLNRAVTLATEVSNGTLNSSQAEAANQEYSSILDEISNIGSTTTYNQKQVFGSTVSVYTGDSSTTGASVDNLNLRTLSSSNLGDTAGAVSYSAGSSVFIDLSKSGGSNANVGDTLSDGTHTVATIDVSYWDTASSSQKSATISAGTGTAYAETVQGLISAINNSGLGISASFGTAQTAGASVGGTVNALTDTGIIINGPVSIGTSASATSPVQVNPDGTDAIKDVQTTQTASAFATGNVGQAQMSFTDSAGANLSGTDLSNQANAQAALTALNSAISNVAAQDGYIGAQINTLNAVANVMSTQQQNIQAAQNAVQATDYAQASSQMSKYEILSQTGISALAQANSVQQEVLKLLQ